MWKLAGLGDMVIKKEKNELTFNVLAWLTRWRQMTVTKVSSRLTLSVWDMLILRNQYKI